MLVSGTDGSRPACRTAPPGQCCSCSRVSQCSWTCRWAGHDPAKTRPRRNHNGRWLHGVCRSKGNYNQLKSKNPALINHDGIKKCDAEPQFSTQCLFWDTGEPKQQFVVAWGVSSGLVHCLDASDRSHFRVFFSHRWYKHLTATCWSASSLFKEQIQYFCSSCWDVLF